MTVTDHGTEIAYVILVSYDPLRGARGQVMLRAQDGGQSWQKFDIHSGMRQIYFNDGNQGWGLRWSGKSKSPDTRIDRVSTKDGGEHWASVSPEA